MWEVARRRVRVERRLRPRREFAARGLSAAESRVLIQSGGKRGGTAIPVLRIEILHPMDLDLSMGTPNPGHPILWLGEAAKGKGKCGYPLDTDWPKNRSRSFGYAYPVFALRMRGPKRASLRMTADVGCSG
jgi:hypothetical protein